jgi:Tfp pilus assembly protein PilX
MHFGNKREHGQTLLIFVLALTVLLGFTAMAIDVGLFFQDRRHLQNTADAAALAGVAELPLNPATAQQKATEWAANNGVDSSQIKNVEVRTTGFPNDTLFVELEGDFGWIFGRVLGKTTDKVGASAAAQTGSLAGGHKMMPWALLEGETNCLDAGGDAIFGGTCQVKVGAEDGISGWRGALDFDGNGGGSSEYFNNIVDGLADWSYCISGQDPPPCQGIVDSLDGNKVGPTDGGIEARWASGAKCDANQNGKDDFDEVFTLTGMVTPKYTVACGDSPWLIIIPIVSYESTPIQTVTIRGWSLAYLESYACVGGSNCNGGKGHWEVSIEIVDASYSQAAGFLGAYDPTSGILIRRLIQ